MPSTRLSLGLTNAVFFVLYRLVVMPSGLCAFFVASLFHPKIRRGLKLRLEAAKNQPMLPKNAIWFHCASGEFEYAKPVIRECKRLFPHIPIVVTYFSPTYQKNIENDSNVDACQVLPWDLPGPIHSFLRRLQPRLLLIARTDLWPELLHQCRQKNIPTYLFSATIKPPDSLKQKLALRLKMKWLHQLNAVFCVSFADVKQLWFLGFPKQKLFAIGDTRYDQVFVRLEHPKAIKETLFTSVGGAVLPLMIAGSTWSEDEKVLLPALAPLVKKQQLALMIVPHEPEVHHLKSLQELIRAAGLNFTTYSEASVWDGRSVLIVDQVGCLAELYQKGDLAFVGGSFKGSVHSVMEPLACGLLTFVGPHHENNREAVFFKTQLLRREKTTPLSTVNVARDASALAELVQVAIQHEIPKTAIRQQVLQQRGASLRLIEHLQVLQSPRLTAP